MSKYHFDRINGLDANSGLTPALAKQDFNNFNGFTPVAGDEVSVKRGSAQTITGALKTIRGGSGDSTAGRIRYTAYGEAQVPYASWLYGTGASNIILNAAGQSFLSFSDLMFDMTGTDARFPINFAASGANDCSNHRVSRCKFRGSNSPSSSIGNGLTLAPAAGATGKMENYAIEDSEFYENSGHGLIIIGARNVAVRRSRAHHNGDRDPTGGHGFSARMLYTLATTGWSLTATTVYQRTLTGAELDVYYVRSNVGAYPRMSRKIGTQSTPALGEFGVVGGILYVNVGVDPSSQALTYAWGRCYEILFDTCESDHNYFNPLTPFHEGHGFVFDDFSDDSMFLNCNSHDNQGAGYSLNRGARNKIKGSIAANNWQAAVIMNPQLSTDLQHNTFTSNNCGVGALAGEIHCYGNASLATINNNIIVAVNSNYAISSETTDTSFAGATNNISGYKVAAEKNPFLTGSIIKPPLLDSLYVPQEPTLRRVGTYLGGRDLYGKNFYNPPSIGAVEDRTRNPRFIFTGVSA